MCVFDVTENGLILREINPRFSMDDVRDATEADFDAAEDGIRDMTALA